MNKVATFVSRHWKLLLVAFIVAFAFGYQMGKDAALRDNAREAAARV